mmetsp:Transcript_27829/g.41204  ORF Transcript_27829/g.41204 Transcript_27829/m.41204 type:complete len:242 (-) Transcript_27829:143-868(-)
MFTLQLGQGVIPLFSSNRASSSFSSCGHFPVRLSFLQQRQNRRSQLRHVTTMEDSSSGSSMMASLQSGKGQISPCNSPFTTSSVANRTNMFLVRSDSSEMHWLDCNKELQSPAKHFTVYSPVFAFSTIFLVLIWFSMEIRKHSGQAAWPHGLKDPLIAPASMSSPQNVHSSSSSSFKEKSFSGRHISFLHSPHTTLLRTILCGPGFCAAEQAKHSSCDRSTKDDPQSAQACRSVPERIWAK